MTPPVIEQRCWNHEDREAVCRCPQCGRSYCRECVTEHQSRLLCAACLRLVAYEARPARRIFRRFLPAGMALGGLVLAWFVFYGAGEALLESTAHMEQSIWQSH
jgi:hypothetical protein